MTSTFCKSLRDRGTQCAVLRFAGLMLLAAVIVTVAGCYETDFEVIDASSAVAVYGVTGTYNVEGGGTMTISAVPLSNDYRFREVSKDNKISTGYLRLVPLKGSIYIVQAKYDDDSFYYFDFYEFTVDSSGSHYRPMDPSIEEEGLDQLAQQNGVTIDWYSIDLVPYLEGSRANIMAFLRAHATLPFTYYTK
ncbi:MAG: hypothetical protein JXA50_00010 [Deltaproteobacteria bacterium]|nr:hypothetical protein [Deltaproteobacteria bacterium]